MLHSNTWNSPGCAWKRLCFSIAPQPSEYLNSIDFIGSRRKTQNSAAVFVCFLQRSSALTCEITFSETGLKSSGSEANASRYYPSHHFSFRALLAGIPLKILFKGEGWIQAKPQDLLTVGFTTLQKITFYFKVSQSDSPADRESRISTSHTHSSAKKTHFCRNRWKISTDWPYYEITGVDESAVVGALQVSRVPHHGAGPAALGASVHVERLIGDDLEQLLHHPAEVGRLPLRLQPLVTEQRRALRRGRGSGDTFNTGPAGGGHLSFSLEGLFIGPLTALNGGGAEQSSLFRFLLLLPRTEQNRAERKRHTIFCSFAPSWPDYPHF